MCNTDTNVQFAFPLLETDLICFAKIASLFCVTSLTSYAKKCVYGLNVMSIAKSTEAG